MNTEKPITELIDGVKPLYFTDGSWRVTKADKTPAQHNLGNNGRPLNPKEGEWYQSNRTKLYYIWKNSKWNIMDWSTYDSGFSNQEW